MGRFFKKESFKTAQKGPKAKRPKIKAKKRKRERSWKGAASSGRKCISGLFLGESRKMWKRLAGKTHGAGIYYSLQTPQFHTSICKFGVKLRTK